MSYSLGYLGLLAVLSCNEILSVLQRLPRDVGSPQRPSLSRQDLKFVCTDGVVADMV